ncbi:hypothetical protein [Nonomuraea sp. NPDC005650]|uniref:alpha/beta fold hydrolase n=1 Tax=Nonomuraea sp. NPDC005650 TaxID=3157045 RepID=UPI0033B8B77B
MTPDRLGEEVDLPFVESNGITTCYEEFGDAHERVMLLIMGVGEQLIAWPDGFCALLAGHGFRVIRFDNRDVGLSTWLDELGDVDLAGLLAGDLSTVRYGLEAAEHGSDPAVGTPVTTFGAGGDWVECRAFSVDLLCTAQKDADSGRRAYRRRVRAARPG